MKNVGIGDARYCLLILVLMLSSSTYGQSSVQIAEEIRRHSTELPFTMPEIKVPVFPDWVVNIVDFGAVADGYSLNTRAFAEAIQSCAKAGGGKVIVPPGTWLTGPIKLESNINLHLERGALIQFSSRFEDFPIIAGLDGKSRRFIVTPPIHAYRATNIAITGDGIVDGAGEAWRYVKKEKQTEKQWKDLIASGGVVTADGSQWWPSQESMEGEEYLKQLEQSGKKITAEEYGKAREFLRPDLVRLIQCNGILLDGPTFQNAPRFHVHPVQSENIIIRNVKILCEWYAQNGDGLDLSATRNVVVYNTTVNVGDDGICIKPSTKAEYQSPGPSCQNIVIADCIVYRAHGGFVIGSESFGGAKNISVRNCVFVGTDVGLRFKSARGRGGLIENIYIDGIQMRDIKTEAILFEMYYGGGSPESQIKNALHMGRPEPVNDRTPRFQDFYIKNIVSTSSTRALLINGLPEMPIKNISLQNVSLTANFGAFIANAEGITLDGCRIDSPSSPVMTVAQSSNVIVKGGSYPAKVDLFMKVDGEKSANIRLVGVDASNAKRVLELGKNVRTDAVKKE